MSQPRSFPIAGETCLSRRNVLKTSGAGFGYLALAGLLGRTKPVSASERIAARPLAPKKPHFPARAKRIIFVFMEGAISQMDTFEYKPQLQKDDGKDAPGGDKLLGSKFRFEQHGETGTWVSELFPNVAKHVDRFCFIRGLHTDTPAHPEAVIQLHTGTALASLTRPSMGAWLLYGLATENEDPPGYITVNPTPNLGGKTNYGSAFMPAYFQGTRVSDTGMMPNLRRESPALLQRRQLDLIQAMNRQQFPANKKVA